MESDHAQVNNHVKNKSSHQLMGQATL